MGTACSKTKKKPNTGVTLRSPGEETQLDDIQVQVLVKKQSDKNISTQLDQHLLKFR